MMLSATLVPRMRDLIRRFAPQHTIIDLNKAMQAATDGAIALAQRFPGRDAYEVRFWLPSGARGFLCWCSKEEGTLGLSYEERYHEGSASSYLLPNKAAR
jgi:hypothetical protein